MPQFIVNYIMTCSGTLQLEAESEEEARKMAESMPLSELGRQADTGDTEILDSEEYK